jgi:hypothetical protein
MRRGELEGSTVYREGGMTPDEHRELMLLEIPVVGGFAVALMRFALAAMVALASVLRWTLRRRPSGRRAA